MLYSTHAVSSIKIKEVIKINEMVKELGSYQHQESDLYQGSAQDQGNYQEEGSTVHDCKYDCLYCTYPMVFLFSILYPPMPWSSLTPENYKKC